MTAELREESAALEGMPTPEVAASSLLADGDEAEAAIARAMMILTAYGALVVRGAIAAAFAEGLQAAMERVIPEKDSNRALVGETLDVSNGRFLTSVPFVDEFASPNLFANAALMPLLNKSLGSDRRLISYNIVEAKPGAGDQHFHKDHRSLFDDQRRDASGPPIAISVSIPLVPMNKMTGTNRLALGSHMKVEGEVEDLPLSYPDLMPGDVLLTDYRLWHGGTANLSAKARPVLFSIYGRAWFRDVSNHSSQPGLIAPPGFVAAQPDRLRSLFDGLQFQGNDKGFAVN